MRTLQVAGCFSAFFFLLQRLKDDHIHTSLSSFVMPDPSGSFDTAIVSLCRPC